jgi:hypothetical protein
MLHVQLVRAKATRLACVLLALALCAGAGLFSASAASAAGGVPTPVVTAVVSYASGTSSVAVSWAKQSVASVQVSLSNSPKLILIGDPSRSPSTYTFNGVEPGLYTARVTFSGQGDVQSNFVEVTVAAVPAAPDYVSTGANGTDVSVDWDAGSSGLGAATSYTVSLAGVPSHDVSGLNNTSATFTGVALGTHTLTVTATNPAGTSAASSASVIVTGLTTPSAPLNLVAKVTAAGAVSVTWEAPASTGGGPISKYDVDLSVTSGVQDPYDGVVGHESREVFLDGNARGHVFSGVGVGFGIYTVTVWASNGYDYGYAKTSPQSLAFAAPPVVVVPPVAVPPVVPKPSAPSAVRSVKVSTAKHGVATVTWAAPASANGTKITGYAITVGGQEKRVTGTRVSFAGLTKGSYPVRVTASNAAGRSVAATARVVVTKANAATAKLTLKAGMRGPDVTRVQTALHMPAQQRTGLFGAATRAAVVHWQKGHHQKASGVVSPAMRGALHV